MTDGAIYCCYKDLNCEKDRAHRSLFFRMIEYESVINKQCCEVNLVRREKQFFQDLSKQLQHNDNLHCLDRIAVVHPIRFNTIRNFQLSPRSTFSASSIFFDYQGFPGLTMDKRFKFSMPEVIKTKSKDCTWNIN